MNQDLSIFEDTSSLDLSTPQKSESVGLYGAIDTGVYPTFVDMAYVEHDPKRMSRTLVLTLRSVDNSWAPKTFYLGLTGKDRNSNQESPFVYDRGGNQQPRAGFRKAEQLHRLILNKPFAQANLEERLVPIFDYASKQEVNQKRDVLVDLIGKPIRAGIHKIVKNKNIPDGKGGWKKLQTKKETNDIHTFFDPKGHSYVERESGNPAEEIKKWQEQYPNDYERNSYNPEEGEAEATASSDASSSSSVADDPFATPDTPASNGTASNGAASSTDDDEDLPF